MRVLAADFEIPIGKTRFERLVDEIGPKDRDAYVGLSLSAMVVEVSRNWTHKKKARLGTVVVKVITIREAFYHAITNETESRHPIPGLPKLVVGHEGLSICDVETIVSTCT